MPLSWLVGAVFAAFVHEAFHYMAAKFMKVQIMGMTVSTGGMIMHMEPMPAGKEFFVSAFGPAGSILLVLFLRKYPELAVCGLVQGLFNLIPVYPLDGGRMMRCILGCHAEKLEMAVIGIGMVFAAILGIRYGIIPILVALLASAKAIQRKFPCKESKLAVQ